MNPRTRAIGRVVLLAALLVLALALPSLALAAPSCTTDCYVSPTGNDANDGATAATPLQSIQLAINTVSPGGTVHLAAGTYSGDTMLSSEGWRELLITKSLTMLGAGSSSTIVQFRPETTGIEIESDATGVITFEGITFTKLPANTDAADFNIRFVVWVTQTFSKVTFKDVISEYAAGRNVVFETNGSSTYAEIVVEDSTFNYAGAYGFTTGGTVSKLTVTGSDFSYNGRTDLTHAVGLDLLAVGGTSNVMISDSTFTNNGALNTNGSKGIDMTAATNVVIDDVTVSGHYDGIAIWEFVGTSSNITIKNSVSTGNRRGITIGSETGRTVDGVTITHNDLSGNVGSGSAVLVFRAGAPFDGTIKNIDINRNNLSGPTGTRGIVATNPAYEEVDGTCNWWGAVDGPGPSGTGSPATGSGNGVTTNVDFTPWLYSDDLDGPCYVGATISIDKVAAGGGATQFTFDVSWSADHVILTDGDPAYVTTPPLPAGNYSITEINFPTGWSLDNATCVGPDEISGDPANLTVSDGDAWVCTFTDKYTPPPANTCPVTAASNRWTDILGIGMGSTKAHKVQAKINIPNYTNLVGLYGQLVAKDTGQAKYVRFIMPGKNNYVQVNAITAPISNQFGNFWYGATLPTAGTKYVTGRWFLKPIGVKGHIPRALVLYPTYNDPAHTYVNVWDTFTPAEGQVDWRPGWTQMHQVHVPIAAPLGPTTFHVEVAVADNDKDARPVWVTVAAGNVTQTQKPTNPDKGDQLNLLTFTLANVPAGTSEIVITIYSPSVALDGVEGDSATLVGMAANYVCTPIAPIP